MSCPAAEIIALYTDGELAGADAAAVRAHLAGCPPCSALVRGLASDRELLAGAPPELAEVDFASLRREILRRRVRILPYVLAAAAVLAAVAAGLMWRGMQGELLPPPVVAHIAAPLPLPPVPVRVRQPKPRPTAHTAARRHSPEFDLPANAFRVPTRNPEVVIIWFSDEINGDPHE